MWNEQQLDDALSTPSPALVADIAKLKGDIMILGAGGRIGPTLAAMAKRAVDLSGKQRRVIAVSRFTDPMAVALLHKEKVETLCADLTDPKQVARLPKAENIIFMAGRKAGTTEDACETWEMNVAVPSMVANHFGGARYVVFSTGNVYPMVKSDSGGNVEAVEPAPVGEYAISCLGRERIFEYAAKHRGARVLLLRLNYAIDLRYGILNDLCNWILNDRPIPLEVPAFNCVWQRYVNEVALRSLHLCSESVERLNVTGPELVSVRHAATTLALLLNRKVAFSGTEGEKAILTNAQKCVALFGYPDMGVEEMMRRQAAWIQEGGRQLGRPTQFEEATGRF